MVVLFELQFSNVRKIGFFDSGDDLLDDSGIDSENFREDAHSFGVNITHGGSDRGDGLSQDDQVAMMWWGSEHGQADDGILC